MVCVGLETLTDTGISGILSFPTSCYHQFYFGVMAVIFLVLSFTLFNRDKDKFLKSDMISSMGVIAIATIFLSLIGTMIGIIQTDIFIEIFVIGMIFIVIWILKK